MTETAKSPELTETDKLWQAYMQKCCEYGQLVHTLEKINSQAREIEKKVEITLREVKSTFNKYQENIKPVPNGLSKPTVPTETTSPSESH